MSRAGPVGARRRRAPLAVRSGAGRRGRGKGVRKTHSKTSAFSRAAPLFGAALPPYWPIQMLREKRKLPLVPGLWHKVLE
ncbi:hypothetical protein [Azospirillum palustre]